MVGVIERAMRGDATAVPALREILKNPTAVLVLGGNLARRAEEGFIEALAGNNLANREAISADLERRRSDLLGANPTPVEVLLVERVMACWLQVQDADFRFAKLQGKLSDPEAEFYQRRMDRANKRFLDALKTLATVRRLAIPALQLNIAEKQVNVAGQITADHSDAERR
jgi:hypothetical protein